MTARRQTDRRGRAPQRKQMIFTPENYKVLTVSVLLIIIGFTIMALENEVYGFISLYISPVLILAGYLLVIVAILKHDEEEPVESERVS